MMQPLIDDLLPISFIKIPIQALRHARRVSLEDSFVKERLFSMPLRANISCVRCTKGECTKGNTEVGCELRSPSSHMVNFDSFGTQMCEKTQKFVELVLKSRTVKIGKRGVLLLENRVGNINCVITWMCRREFKVFYVTSSNRIDDYPFFPVLLMRFYLRFFLY